MEVRLGLLFFACCVLRDLSLCLDHSVLKAVALQQVHGDYTEEIGSKLDRPTDEPVAPAEPIPGSEEA